MTNHAKKKQVDNYKVKIFQMVVNGQIKAIPGRVDRLDVKHDPWCAFFHGGRCNCDPIIAVITTQYGGEAAPHG